MEKRKRFDDELLDLVNPGADDSFLNEYLEDEESKKKLKKSSPLKTIKISFKKFSQPNQPQTIVSTQAQTSAPHSAIEQNIPLLTPPVQSIQSPLKKKETVHAVKQYHQNSSNNLSEKENIKVLNDKRLDYKPKEARLLGKY